MERVKKVFEKYNVEYDVVLERVMNNETLYLRLLSMLFEDENLKKLGIALEENNLDDAFFAAHTLKGVVGNLGLADLYKALGNLVEPLRSKEEREDYPLLYKAVTREFDNAAAFYSEIKEVV